MNKYIVKKLNFIKNKIHYYYDIDKNKNPRLVIKHDNEDNNLDIIYYDIKEKKWFYILFVQYPLIIATSNFSCINKYLFPEKWICDNDYFKELKIFNNNSFKLLSYINIFKYNKYNINIIILSIVIKKNNNVSQLINIHENLLI